MTTKRAWDLPDWRKPRYKSEGDSLVLDIQKYLEGTEEDSVERDIALQEAFMLATYYPSGVTRTQRDGIMAILSLYGREAIRPVLLAVGDCSIAEVLDLAASFVEDYNLPKHKSKEEVANDVREQFTQLVREAKEENVDVGRSILVWQNHQLMWLYPGGCVGIVDKNDPKADNKDSKVLQFLLSPASISLLAALWLAYVLVLIVGPK